MDFRRAGFDIRPFVPPQSERRIMGFQTAEALTRIFPELARLVLPQGIVDIYRNIPPNDVPLIGTTTKVLVRSHLHPEIVQLLLQTMVEAHSGPNIFQRAGEFPNGTLRLSPQYLS